MKTSLWLNVDPLALFNPTFEKEFYFDGQHNGGIYNSGNLSNYNYCYQNPIKYVDPNGKQSVAGTLMGVAKMGITATILYMAYPNCGGECKSLFKSNYIGPSSSTLSAKDQRKTEGVEPVDEVDLAAFNHDVSYDKIKAAGVKGAVIDLATLPADIKLLSDAKNTAEKYSNGSIDNVTGDKVSLVTWARADAVIKAFEPLITEKKARIYASEQATKAKENIKLTIENAKKSLMNPTVW
ncbi:hypothetical protein HNQ02_002941 [Flavobacterium sp. 7E]|nr:hypothetical protein [Flavobacterium sp. 7E]